ncbi:MAG: hypothetical protein F4Z18_04240 [Caldilineaceae bacterium SB0666_bin_21]|nr:hypothetical protein [Caldilineaceae bacterium SB0666_bin_21]
MKTYSLYISPKLSDDEKRRLRMMISYRSQLKVEDGDTKPQDKLCIKLDDIPRCFNSQTAVQFDFKDGEIEYDDDKGRERIKFELQSCNAEEGESVTIEIMLLAGGQISFPASHIVDWEGKEPVPVDHVTKIVGEGECPKEHVHR